MFWHIMEYYQPRQKSSQALVGCKLWMLYNFFNRSKNKCKSKVSVTRRFGKQNRNMKSNWNKEPHDSNIALRKDRGRQLGLSGRGCFNQYS